MKGVIDPIRVESIGANDWKLLDDFDWYGITVPSGFITDFASVPRVFWSIVNPVGRIKPAAIVHDYLYSKKGKLENKKYSRKQSDKEFLEIMKVVGMDWIKRGLVYRAVRMFGLKYWNK